MNFHYRAINIPLMDPTNVHLSNIIEIYISKVGINP